MDAVFFEHVCQPVDGVALADAAGIDIHARFGEFYRAIPGIENEILIADVIQGAAHLGAMRQVTASLVESPDLHQRPHSNVECSLAPAAVLDARGEQIEEL